jgi:hypothetical protein
VRRCLCSECCLLYGQNFFLFLVAEKARVVGKRFVRPVTHQEVKPEEVQASHTLVCAFNFCPALLFKLVCYGLLYFALLGTLLLQVRVHVPAEGAFLTSNATLFFFTYTFFLASLALLASVHPSLCALALKSCACCNAGPLYFAARAALALCSPSDNQYNNTVHKEC